MKTHIYKVCSATKPDQSKCENAVIDGSEFCFFHDPLKAQQRREAQARGGRENRMKTLDSTAPDVRLDDVRDAQAVLKQTLNWVLKGTIDPRIANSVCFIVNTFMRAAEQGNLETRIEDLEALLEARVPTSDLKLTGERKEQRDERQAVG